MQNSRQIRMNLARINGICAFLMLLAVLTFPTTSLAQQNDNLPTPLPEDFDQDEMWVEIDGQVYGARPDDLGPIGGRTGYQRVITEGDYHVADRQDLIDALDQAQPGEIVFVEPDAEIDLTVWVHIEDFVLEVPEGVTLASNRGQDGAPGALIYSDTFDTAPLIRATGKNVRITGLRLRGPDPKRRMDLHRASFRDGRGRDFYYSFPTSRGISAQHDSLEVDNCELWGFSHSAIRLGAGSDHSIHHNHIHHNQRHGLGYGVSLDQAAVDIEYNLFDWNRHSIAGTGSPPSGYAARHNIVLSNANGHLLDMHGGRDRDDGTDIAGTWMEFENNTLVNTQQGAIVIRGEPEEGAIITRNWFHNEATGDDAIRSEGRTQVRSNVYGIPPQKKREEYGFE